MTTQDVKIPLNQIAEELAKRIDRYIPRDKKLWDAQDCASYLQVTKHHFSERLSNHHDFPQPIRLPSPTGKNPHRRWYASEVIQWAAQLR